MNKHFPKKIYIAWQAMKSRCQNPNHTAFKRYGERGIFVCKRWKNSCENFFADMGLPPKNGRWTVERKRNWGPYAPGNCRWATYREQACNTRRNVRIKLNGKNLTVREWCRELGYGHNREAAIYLRMRKGWSGLEAITTPIFRPGGKRTDSMVSIDGEARTITGWVKHRRKDGGPARFTVFSRIRRGWDVIEAITTPPDKSHCKK